MDSLKAFSGYGKVEDQSRLEDQAPHRNRSTIYQNPKKPLKIAASVFGIILLTLTVGLLIQAAVHKSNSTGKLEYDENPSSLSSIKVVCNFTRFPDSCFTSIAFTPLKVTINYSDPVAIFNLSLHVSINELSRLSPFLKSLALNSNGAAAVRDCESQVEDSLNQLNDSVSALLEVRSAGIGLTDRKINDINTWISAALTYEETCLDGLEEVDSSVLGEVRRKMQKSKEYTSNSLAIIANMNTILNMFRMSKH